MFVWEQFGGFLTYVQILSGTSWQIYRPLDPEVPSGVAIYVNTQVVPYDSQGNTAGVTTNQSLEYSFQPSCSQRGLPLYDLSLFLTKFQASFEVNFLVVFVFGWEDASDSFQSLSAGETNPLGNGV